MTPAPVLDWDRPARAMTSAGWQAISADSAPPGVYTPNMSRAGMEKWKGRHIGGSNPRVEIRKTAGGAQLLIVVTDAEITISMNGRARLTPGEAREMSRAISEAQERLASQ